MTAVCVEPNSLPGPNACCCVESVEPCCCSQAHHGATSLKSSFVSHLDHELYWDKSKPLVGGVILVVLSSQSQKLGFEKTCAWSENDAFTWSENLCSAGSWPKRCLRLIELLFNVIQMDALRLHMIVQACGSAITLTPSPPVNEFVAGRCVFFVLYAGTWGETCGRTVVFMDNSSVDVEYVLMVSLASGGAC